MIDIQDVALGEDHLFFDIAQKKGIPVAGVDDGIQPHLDEPACDE